MDETGHEAGFRELTDDELALAGGGRMDEHTTTLRIHGERGWIKGSRGYSRSSCSSSSSLSSSCSSSSRRSTTTNITIELFYGPELT